MNYWYYFWVICFFTAGSTFSVIAVIVLVRGIADLRQMFAQLESRSHRGDSSQS